MLRPVVSFGGNGVVKWAMRLRGVFRGLWRGKLVARFRA